MGGKILWLNVVSGTACASGNCRPLLAAASLPGGGIRFAEASPRGSARRKFLVCSQSADGTGNEINRLTRLVLT